MLILFGTLIQPTFEKSARAAESLRVKWLTRGYCAFVNMCCVVASRDEMKNESGAAMHFGYAQFDGSIIPTDRAFLSRVRILLHLASLLSVTMSASEIVSACLLSVCL